MSTPTKRTRYSTKVILSLAAKSNGLCGICELALAPQDATVDHIIPLSRGGADDDENRHLAHQRCNLIKQARLVEELVSSIEKPERKPTVYPTLPEPTEPVHINGSEAMTLPDAAREIGINQSSVWRRIKQGTLEAQRFGPKMWLIPRVEVERAKAAGRLKPGPRPKRRTE